ncbi:hypothetical protein NFI96_000084 [Prochilodus magdalenae]|nr:hypothetical protein NFI96_000084 [Prochilodus magdalenae]
MTIALLHLPQFPTLWIRYSSLSPLLYTLFTYACMASQSNTSIIKFADDTTVIGLITGGDETAYRREVAELVDWCDYNNLSLNTDKTKEMIVDPRRRRQELHTPLFIGGTEVERVKTFKFPSIHISDDLTSSHNTHYIVRKSQQRLYFLRGLRTFGMSAQILSNFYRSTIESVLTSSITVWYGNCTAQDRKALQRVIKTAQSISGAAFPSLQDIYRTRVIRRAHSIIRDSTHPQHSLFTLLPSARRKKASANIFMNMKQDVLLKLFEKAGDLRAVERANSIVCHGNDPERISRALKALQQDKKEKFALINGLRRPSLRLR